MQRYSILMKNMDHCYICGSTENIHIHEIFYGTANRKISIKEGLCISLCSLHHNMSKKSVHLCASLDKEIKQEAQVIWQKLYYKTENDFIKLFGKSYIQ